MNHTLKTLGDLLSHTDTIIKRHSTGLLRRLQELNPQDEVQQCYCEESGLSVPHYKDDH